MSSRYRPWPARSAGSSSRFTRAPSMRVATPDPAPATISAMGDPRQHLARQKLELLHPPVKGVQPAPLAAVQGVELAPDPVCQLLGLAEQVELPPVVEVH